MYGSGDSCADYTRVSIARLIKINLCELSSQVRLQKRTKVEHITELCQPIQIANQRQNRIDLKRRRIKPSQLAAVTCAKR